MKLKYMIFVLCCLAFVGKIEAVGPSMGPIGKLILNTIYDCKGDQKPTGDEIALKINLRKIGDKDDKVIDVEGTTKIDVNDNLTYIIDIKKFENGGWKNVYTLKGKPCHDIDRYLKKLWSKLISAVVPKPEKICPIPAGSYKLDGFLARSEDIEYKAIFYGKLMVTISVLDKNNKILFCTIAEGDSQAPL